MDMDNDNNAVFIIRDGLNILTLFHSDLVSYSLTFLSLKYLTLT